MKNLIKLLSVLAIAALMASCGEQEKNRIFYKEVKILSMDTITVETPYGEVSFIPQVGLQDRLVLVHLQDTTFVGYSVQYVTNSNGHLESIARVEYANMINVYYSSTELLVIESVLSSDIIGFIIRAYKIKHDD